MLVVTVVMVTLVMASELATMKTTAAMIRIMVMMTMPIIMVMTTAISLWPW